MQLHRMWGAVLTGFLLCQVSEAVAGIGSLRQRWPLEKKITICFFAGSDESRLTIAKIANEWTENIGVTFDFGRPPHFNSCDPKQRYDVRVGFAEPGIWSYVGTDSLSDAIAQYKPTINFNGLDERVDPSERGVILEKFGHVLGFLHAEQDPETKCRTELNLEYFSATGISDKDIDKRYFPPELSRSVAPNNGEYISTGIDNLSIMRLFTEPKQFKDGEKNRCYGPPTDKISERDRKLAQLLYPPKPDDVSANADPKQLTVRFEGALAPEHFGYMVAALHDVGKIDLKKRVAFEQTIEPVIAQEGLAPRGVTTRKLEDFLCQVNPHICERSRGKNIWHNVVANANYVDQGQNCGEKSLSKSVFCVPNVRLEPYTVLSTVPYDAKRGPLKQVVVDQNQGCTAWDESCRTVIRRLNREYANVFVDNERLVPPTFTGELRIPRQAYRLVVEYRNEQERDALEKKVLEVINARAKQLKIGSDEVAIEVTYPIGKPEPQAVSLDAVGTTEALKAMSYPFDEAADLAPWVHAGIWDTTVDARHCYLQGLIHVTTSDLPSSLGAFEPPPLDKPTACGDLRNGTYPLSLRYDHGTAVAGILSARKNDNGVTGIVPGMKLWAWEVLDADQFNTGRQDPYTQMVSKFDLDPKVINISQSYVQKVEGKQTYLYNLLFGTRPRRRGYDNSMLFVASAGITRTDAGDRIGAQIDTPGNECTIYPACWSNSRDGLGLISVVALNDQGNDLLRFKNNQPATNYGLAFDVAAVGVARTTFYGDWIGSFPGSSAAAPYVTGLAAMIAAKMRSYHIKFDVQELKRRILFTADNLPEINGFSRYGRINFWKALNFEYDLIRFDSEPLIGACHSDPCWQKVKILRNLNALITVTTGTAERGGQLTAQKQINFTDLKSILSEGNDKFTVVYMEDAGLRRITGATLVASNKKIVEVDGKQHSLDLYGLKEYVSCSWFEGCPP